MTDCIPVRRVKIDVTIDLMCPYCLVGLLQLQYALSRYRSIHHLIPFEPTVRILPYQLGPCADDDKPASRRSVREKKYGKDVAKKMFSKSSARLEELGIVQVQDGPMTSSHTAQRLLTYTLFHSPDRQLPFAMDLMVAYQRDGRHLNDRDLLSDLAVHHGVFPDPLSACEFLDSDDCDAEVRKAYVRSRRLGVVGVPFFVFQDKYAASGAMGVEEFVRLIEETIHREEMGYSSSPSPVPSLPSPISVRSEKMRYYHPPPDNITVQVSSPSDISVGHEER